MQPSQVIILRLLGLIVITAVVIFVNYYLLPNNILKTVISETVGDGLDGPRDEVLKSACSLITLIAAYISFISLLIEISFRSYLQAIFQSGTASNTTLFWMAGSVLFFSFILAILLKRVEFEVNKRKRESEKSKLLDNIEEHLEDI